MRFEVLPLDTKDARHAGEIRARGLVLITRNLREFERVHGLSTENRQDEPST